MSNKSSWQSSQFAEQDTDPLAGFANIMDVMLVFALGLMLALVAQSQELQEKFSIESNKTETIEVIEVTTATELVDAPESLVKPSQCKSQRHGIVRASLQRS